MHRRFKAHIATGSLSLLLAVLLMASPASAAGELDPSFDGDGKVVTDFGGAEGATASAIQNDGRIVVVGFRWVAGSGYDFAAARYNVGGSLDPSFDGDGKVVTDLFAESEDIPLAVAIQGDGKIVVAGAVYSRLALVRYKPDGSLDTGFHGDGKRMLNLGSASDVAIQRNGKILVAGPSLEPRDFLLTRFTPRGYLDTSFDGDGKALTDFGGSDTATAIAVQDNGKFVVGGDSDGVRPADDFALARHNLDGSLDTGFHFDGRQVTDLFSRDTLAAIAIQANGKIVAAGSTDRRMGDDFALARYNRDGSLDAGFDGDGRLLADPGAHDVAWALAIQGDGRILTAGSSIAAGDPSDFALTRHGSTGALDPGFDGDGKLFTDFGGDDRASGVLIQGDGKIVASGTSAADFALARYLAAP